VSQDASWLGRQQDQEIELLGRQPDLHFFPVHPAAIEVDQKITMFDIAVQFLLLSGRAAQSGTNAREQFLRAKRLDHIVIRARVESADFAALVIPDRQHQNRHLAPRAKALADSCAIDVRKAQIQNHETRPIAFKRLQRVRPRRCHGHRVSS